MTIEIPEPDRDQPIMRVVRAVAREHDVDPVELAPPLGTVMPTDALTSLLRSSAEANLEVTFEYADCRISISNGDLTVDPLVTEET